jgi:hypothetical protein
MRIIIHPKYQHLETEILKLTQDFFSEGDLMVQGSRNTIKSNTLGDEKVTIKYFKTPGLFKSVIYSFFKSTKARRSFEYALYLRDHNIQTPFPIAFIEERNSFGLVGQSFYICHHIEYDFTIRELIHDSLFPDRNTILQQFTAFTFAMHEAQVNFLDHSPGNTLIVKRDSNQYDFYLIDLNRMQFETLSIEDRMDNFKKMWLSKAMIKVVAAAYAKLSHQNEDKLHQILLEKSREFKSKTAKKKYFKRKVTVFFKKFFS